MGNSNKVMTAYGEVAGKSIPEDMICQENQQITAKSIFFGFDPLQYTFPVLLSQMIAIILTTRLIYHFIKPYKQSIISAQVLAGIVLGPSLLGRNRAYLLHFFPPGGKITLQTLSNMGFIIHLFLLGVRVDPTLLKKVGTRGVLIGASAYAVPFIGGSLVYFGLIHTLNEPENVTTCLSNIITLNSMTSFPVITSLLADLNILNSDLGKLATYTSMVAEVCSYAVAIFFQFYSNQKKWMKTWAFFWSIAYMLSIVFILRPFVIWLTAKKTKKEENKEDIPFYTIMVILLMSAFITELLGLHAAYGTFWLGVALPDGPPIGSALVQKLDTMATTLLLPVFVAISGLQTDFFVMGVKNPYIIEMVIFVVYLAKFSGTMGASLFCKVPFCDALPLALIMCCQGIIEVSTVIMWRDARILETECFNLVVISLLLVTGIARPLIVYLYDPSRRYKTNTRRTILHAKQKNLQLRLLVCIQDASNVPMMVNVLEISNPTELSPISVFVLHVLELKGRSTSILVPHHHLNKLHPDAAQSQQIVNAFRRFETQHQGSVIAQYFTGIAPYASMHDDICTLALDKIATFIIIPFHKRFAIDGTVGLVNSFMRNVNLNVLDKAPCSVGLLIDRGEISGCRTVLTSQSLYRVALLFLGGPDDMEALGYCIRMAEYPDISVTLIHFSSRNVNFEKQNNYETQLINEFKDHASTNEKIQYVEEFVSNGVDTTQVIGSLGNSYDLVIVGRHHEAECPLLLGLTEWSECPELGIIGDMLASPDFHFSVLVVQQQPGDSLDIDSSYTLLPSAKSVSVDSRVDPTFSDEV